MHPNIAAALIAAVVGAGSAALVVKFGPQPKTKVVHVTSSTASPATIARTAADQWPEIEQVEVDALTKDLSAVAKDKRRDVTIFCHSDSRCGDLALNLENSFESARWTVARKLVPLPDGYVGILVNDESVRAVLAKATSLRPTKLDEEVAGGGVGIIIGVKTAR